MMTRELWIFLVFVCLQVSACDIGWFGSTCQYKCHCNDNSCDIDGLCVNGSRCEQGWFGPACQYENLATKAKLLSYSDDDQKDMLSDDNDVTCHKSLRVLFITWKLNHAFYWIRLVFNESGHNGSLTVSLKPFHTSDKWFHNNDYVTCDRETRSWVDARTLDIYCEISVSIHEVMLEGEGIRSLCSVYVSGGRNLALKQKTWQSSTYPDGIKSISSNAVDGNTDGDYDHGSCTHTWEQDMHGTASWNAQFSLPAYVNRFILYNRDKCCQDRLKGFYLATSTSDGELVHQYTDYGTDALNKYIVLSPNRMKPISQITVSTSRSTETDGVYLNLCEVEVFGDWACPLGTYGMDCNNSCNCRLNNETCFVGTGGCPSGCAPGYTGEGCSEECESGSWGPSCSQRCDSRCAGSDCDAVTGQCTGGCVSGYQFPYCAVECPDGTWGVNCTKQCQKNCLNESCDGSTGLCLAGCVAGYKPPECVQSCESGTWGPNCSLTCDPGCLLRSCHRETGPNCTQACESGTWGPNCSLTCEPGCHRETGQCDRGCGICCAPPNCTQAPIRDVVSVGQSHHQVSPTCLGALGILASAAFLVIVVLLACIVALLRGRQMRSFSWVTTSRNSEADNEVDLIQFSDRWSKTGRNCDCLTPKLKQISHP